MMKTATIRIHFVRAAVFAASAMIAILASGRCEASCGEYVYSRFRTPAHSAPDVSRHIAQEDHGVPRSGLLRPSMDQDFPHQTPPLLPAPCSGPGCRQNPIRSVPVAPQSTTESGQQDRLISGVPDIELPSDVSHRRDLKDRVRALRGFPLLIEMPPEFAG